MKKFQKCLFAIICGAPLLLLSGCGSTNHFTVTTKTSNVALGNVSGGSTSPWSEGTQLTLKATAKSNANPFICWIKDYTKVFTTENEVKVTVSQKTAGNYTALFEETTPKSMMYATLTEISYLTTDYSSIEYEVSYAPTYDTTTYQPLAVGAMKGTSDNAAFQGSVFNLLDQNTEYVSYIFKVDIIVTDIAGTAKTTYSFKDMNLTNENFDTSGAYVLTNQALTLRFDKLSTALFV